MAKTVAARRQQPQQRHQEHYGHVATSAEVLLTQPSLSSRESVAQFASSRR